ncbi:Phosphatidylinositol 3-phosphate binding protein [Phytophthora megakarya]|uniref:Phosphatidylinositol 3-phosphate binding protein n=1 Tax=Phytophthora megakarya TaxID=4795 RepID=A0A225WL82_9STRA|nr:Phosphatidylinositol 3-phosphate binding protein [Phytophthora megakarya]
MRYPPSVALSRSRSDCSKASSCRPQMLPRSTSTSTSSRSTASTMSSYKSGKKRPRSLVNHLGGFVLHSVLPTESSILQYTSMVSPGTHTEYELVLEDTMVSGVGERWYVSRRYSGFRSLRDELARVFDRRNHPGAAVENKHAHCQQCAPMIEALDKLSSKYFPKRRLWGSKSPKVVQQRAEQFFKYLQGLLALATSPSTRRCPLVALGFAVQLRTFLTLEREPYRDAPGAFGGGAVPFLLNEMTVMDARTDNATTLMTIDELDAAYADSPDNAEYDLGFHHLDDSRDTSSVSDLPSPVYVLEEQDELRSWDGFQQWEETTVARCAAKQ